ncbi:MAG: tRNA (adenosine(37)-N6)-threonylcarbamoyltransferase complex ATPase subunit type 1 TsaE, partial [Bacteroidota bacterium]|nr:tRNA (adenosine(37)-N6)-threonylcarbamoyltransferase complex ATPase subunit type 1 TsaE [Bacteroidota bacterium]
LYRIKNIDELHSIGFFEYIESNNLCFIEWGDMIEKDIRDSYNKFVIEKRQNNRIIKMVK